MIKCGKLFSGVCVLGAVLLFGGCGSDALKSVTTSTLQVQSDGTMKEALIDSSEGETFTAEDVRAFIDEDLAGFVQDGGSDQVKLEDVSMDEQKVRVDMSYGSYGAYADYHNTDCFYGTYSDAKTAGYSFDTALEDNNGEVAALATIDANDDGWHVLILQEPVDIVTPGNILYTSTNVTITGKKTATIKADEGNSDAVTISELAYIICR